jgi:HEAT repeat protein
VRGASPKLIEALSDEEEGVVTAPVQALGEIGDAIAVDLLIRLLRGTEHVTLIL